MGISSCDDSAQNAIAVSLQHNPTYSTTDLCASARCEFRRKFAELLDENALRQQGNRDETLHVEAIEDIAAELSKEFGPNLKDNRLRIGTAQKAYNLHLKTIWCLDPDQSIPIHCPVDRIVLEAAGVKVNGQTPAWTKLDSIANYREWIQEIRLAAEQTGVANIAIWELFLWNRNS